MVTTTMDDDGGGGAMGAGDCATDDDEKGNRPRIQYLNVRSWNLNLLALGCAVMG
jgi:hypothetical protein